jgi:hypothetical protein
MGEGDGVFTIGSDLKKSLKRTVVHGPHLPAGRIEVMVQAQKKGRSFGGEPALCKLGWS